MAIPGRLKIYQDGGWKYVGFGPQGTSGFSGWSGYSGSGGGNPITTATIVLSAQGALPGITNGCATQTKIETGSYVVVYSTLDFDPATQQYAIWNMILPYGYPANGTFTAKFYWTAASGAVGQNVCWDIQARAFADNDAIDQDYGSAVEVVDSYIASGDMHVSSATAAITAAGTPSAGEFISFRVFRNASSASDTLTGDARLIMVKLEYTTG